MRRREFITLLGGAATASATFWPRTMQAQQARMPVVGLLRSTPAAPFQALVAALRQGLNEEGFVEGRNVAIEQRWADNQRDRLVELAADLVRRQTDVIVTHGIGVEVARATAAATPIVFVVGDDPVKMGFVSNLSRPAGNITGITFFGGGSLIAKRLELLRDLVPKATVVAVLLDPDNAGTDTALLSLEAAGRALGLKIVPVTATGERDLDAAFARIVATGADALMFGGGPLLRSQLPQIVALAARHAIPTIYELRDYVDAGGLISYSASFPGAYRQAGLYAGRILKGARPSELPVLQPTTFELAINLKTAKALGLKVPDRLLLSADQVVE